MLFSRTKLLFFLVVILLAGCRPEVIPATPPPAPAIWRVQITPAVGWLAPIFHDCMAEYPGAGLVLEERPAPDLLPAEAAFTFRWGEEGAVLVPFSVLIGQDELAVVVNPKNPLATLSVTQLQQFASGTMTDWGDLKLPGLNGSVTVYGYATTDDIQQVALGWLKPGPLTVLAPDPAAVRSAVSQQVGALGYLPARWVDATVRRVTISGAEILRKPLLVQAAVEPQGDQRAWLLCVQEKAAR